MQVKCEYCGAYIEETDKFCPSCGAVNDSIKRSSDGTPKTITELKAWYVSKNLPPQDTTRFFIGVDYKEPRAFGIYKDGDNFIVYKNKDNGERAIRYKGTDEAYAVNEIYLKLKSEILNQKAHNLSNKKSGSSAGSSPEGAFFEKAGKIIGGVFSGLMLLVVLMIVVTSIVDAVKDLPYKDKYFKYENEVYYCNSYVNDDWYVYDTDSKDYYPVYLPEDVIGNINEYRYDKGEKWDSSIEKFEDTETGQYIREQESTSSSSDSDYSWDSSDSWDSDDTDWGSDW